MGAENDRNGRPQPVETTGVRQGLGNPKAVNIVQPAGAFSIDLFIKPDSLQARDDVYSLLLEDGSVHQHRSVRDDAIKGDGKLTLVFRDLKPGRRYSLEIDQGGEGKYFAFYKVPLQDLLRLDRNLEEVQDGPGDQPLPDTAAALEFEDGLPDLPDEQLRRQSGSAYEPPDEDDPRKGADRLVL